MHETVCVIVVYCGDRTLDGRVHLVGGIQR